LLLNKKRCLIVLLTHRGANMNRFDLEEKIMAVWSTKEDVALLLRQHCDRAEPMTEDEVQNALLGIETLMEMRCQELWDCFTEVFELRTYFSTTEESAGKNK
jgi:methyl coenzyme M reductase gamma subunit